MEYLLLSRGLSTGIPFANQGAADRFKAENSAALFQYKRNLGKEEKNSCRKRLSPTNKIFIGQKEKESGLS